MGTPEPRILVADDQADILQALRLLLRQEGFAVETAASPTGVLAALERSEFDALLMDLNYTRDTTSGREGPRRPGPDPAAGCLAARRGHDGVRQRGGRRRGDAARRAGLPRKAVGQHPAGVAAAHPGGAGPRAPPRPASRRGKPGAARAAAFPTWLPNRPPCAPPRASWSGWPRPTPTRCSSASTAWARRLPPAGCTRPAIARAGP